MDDPKLNSTDREERILARRRRIAERQAAKLKGKEGRRPPVPQAPAPQRLPSPELGARIIRHATRAFRGCSGPAVHSRERG